MRSSALPIRAVAGSPILWGALVSAGYLVGVGRIGGGWLARYTAGQPAACAATVLFAIGLASLVIQSLKTLRRRASLASALPGLNSAQQLSMVDCRTMLAAWEDAAPVEGSLLARACDACRSMVGQDSAVGLEEQLARLAEQERDRLYASYGLVRLLSWTIPLVGFLGVALAVAAAFTRLSSAGGDLSLAQVLAGLGMAFDSAVAGIAYSIVLLSVQYFVEKADWGVARQVELRAADELLGRFQCLPAGAESQIAAVRQMAESVLAAFEQAGQRQTSAWQRSMEAAGSRWQALTEAGGASLENALSRAVAEGLDQHAQRVADFEQQLAAQQQKHWSEVQGALAASAEAANSLQANVVRQADLLTRAVEATAEVTRLEDALNRNLASLAAERNFEETVMSLAAAIHLLTARLNPAAEAPIVQLNRRAGHAA